MLLLLPLACVTNLYQTTYVVNPEGEDDTGDPVEVIGDGEEAGWVDPETLLVDPFADGHVFRLDISEEQAALMEEQMYGGDASGDEYELGDDRETYADRFIVTDAISGNTANFGKTELWIKGSSTARPWDQIPSLRADLGGDDDPQLGGLEHLQFQNGQVGSIFREEIALAVFEAFAYPVPRASFAWVSTSIWDADFGELMVPYTFVEVYKGDWCDRALGGCVNLWEAPGGDITASTISLFESGCQLGEDACDTTRLNEFATAVDAATADDVKGQTAAWLDWERFHEFQCLSWLTATGDDYIHTTNNTVLAELPDGRFVFLPHSTDISAGQEWYPIVKLKGSAKIPTICQKDSACWADTLATCDAMVSKLERGEVDWLAIVDDAYARLEENGMLRDGDDARYAEIRAWYEARTLEAREVLNRQLGG